MEKAMIIEVSCLVDFEDIDADDTAPDGTCAVDGSYGLTLTDVPEGADRDAIIDATSLQFHRKIAIASLDDFDIVYRERGEQDIGLHEIGDVPFERENVIEP